MRRTSLLILIFSGFVFSASTALAGQKPDRRLNVLLITVDDMNYDSLGVTGCKVANISPNIDKLARQGMLFRRAHVTIAVCQPTRAVWMTGLYPHKNGARGFEPIKRGIPTLPEILRQHGYYLGIMGKVPHVVPTRRAAWHYIVAAKELQTGRNPDLYYRRSKVFFERVKKSGQPFFLMANAQDPHRPFAGSAQEKRRRKGKKKRRGNFPEVKNPYKPKDVTVPGFLPDIPQVRLEMSEYYTSVRRADAVVGAVLRALREAGLEENTLVIFLSDHGMPLPFAKTNCYYHSTHTPLIVRWPGTVRPGSVDDAHFVSGIDMTPTILDALKLPPIKGADGRSFKPLLSGQKQKGRETLFTVFHKTAGRRTYEMRAVHDSRYLYIYNAWSDGKTVFRNESQNGRTMQAMKAAAVANPKIAARVKLFLYRVPEELYDWQKDPDCRHNLIADAKHRDVVVRMRELMRTRMQAFDDSLIAHFQPKTK